MTESELAIQRDRVFADIDEQCMRNDEQWGGPEHDDQHRCREWIELIRQQLGGAQFEPHYRDRILAVAALAVQAIESYERKERASKPATTPTPTTTSHEQVATLLANIAELGDPHSASQAREAMQLLGIKPPKGIIVRVKIDGPFHGSARYWQLQSATGNGRNVEVVVQEQGHPIRLTAPTGGRLEISAEGV